MTGWKRTLTVAAVAQTLSIMGFSFVTPFIPLYVQELGIHGAAEVTLWAAILAGGSSVFMAVAAPMWGVLADRYGRKIMVARSMFSAALLIGLMGVAQNVWQLLALRMLQGAFTGTVSASQALVSSQSPQDRLGFSMGVMQTAVFSGTSFGPLAGGLVADYFGFRRSFLVAALILLLAGALVSLFIPEEARFAARRDEPRPRFLQGVRAALALPALLAMIGTLFAVQFATTVVLPILPQFVEYLQGSAGHAATITGVILAGTGLAGALSSLSVGYVSDRIGYKRVLVSASLLAAVVSIPQFFVTSTWQLLVLRVILGVIFGAVMPAATALVATLVPAEQRGVAYGLTGSATSIGFAAGPLTAAAVVAAWGIRPVFLTAALLMALIAVWVGLMVQVPAPPAQPEPVSVEGDEAALASELESAMRARRSGG